MAQSYNYMNSIPSAWKQMLHRYSALPETSDQVFVTYVWVDGTREFLRSKTRTLHQVPTTVANVSKWSFCGFGTYMSMTNADSQRILVPRAMYDDPFHYVPGSLEKKNKLVLCDTYEYDDEYKLVPTSSNTRSHCNEVMEKAKEYDPWFGIEQEYILYDLDRQPLGWPKGGYPAPMGPYFCSVGAGLAVGRDIVHSHYKASIYAGLNICAINGEAVMSQWEFCTGPTEGIKASDELWMARFILNRVSEDFGVCATFDPKPIVGGDWSGSGAHCNLSTKEMREDDGIKAIEQAIEKLKIKHYDHIKVYDPNEGRDNERRLTGKNETPTIHAFSHGIEDRNVSVRIPIEVHLAKKGYFEDRRPSANCDPYQVTAALIETCVLNGSDNGET